MIMTTSRLAPWDTLGEITPHVDTTKEALHNVGMDWDVMSRPVLVDSGVMGPLLTTNRFVANVRQDNNEILGIVSDKYEIIQNSQAFAFLDYMIPEGLEILKGGVVNGRKVWLVTRYNTIKGVDGDQIDTFIIFTNTHDGKGSVRACISPIRPACQNALNFAFKKSYRSWSISHTGNVQEKLRTAEETMALTGAYMKEFQLEGLRLMEKSLTDAQVGDIMVRLFPLEKEASIQKENIVMERRGIVTAIYKTAPDLGRGTAWDLMNAVSDYSTHYLPAYDEVLYRKSNFNKLLKGHPVIDAAYKLVA